MLFNCYFSVIVVIFNYHTEYFQIIKMLSIYKGGKIGCFIYCTHQVFRIMITPIDAFGTFEIVRVADQSCRY